MFKFLNLILGLFYDRRYLTGRFFERSRGGYVWAVRGILWQKIFGFNRSARYPVSPFVALSNPENLKFHPDNIDNLQTPGVYFQNLEATITLGKGTFISPNVGLITQNHDVDNLAGHVEAAAIKIGDDCWLGMNAVVLPGIILGDRTIVGAGAIVTKSFPDGHIVLVGNPAKPVKQLNPK